MSKRHDQLLELNDRIKAATGGKEEFYYLSCPTPGQNRYVCRGGVFLSYSSCVDHMWGVLNDALGVR